MRLLTRWRSCRSSSWVAASPDGRHPFGLGALVCQQRELVLGPLGPTQRLSWPRR